MVAGVSGAGTPAVRVDPAVSVVDRPLTIKVSGLVPRTRVAVTLRSTDAKKVEWVSSARFRADGRGRIDLNHSSSLGGSYEGVWGMGLIASMFPTLRDPQPGYFWSAKKPLRFTLTVSVSGRVVATAVFRRELSSVPLTSSSQTVGSAGFKGIFFAPRSVAHRTAVLLVSGSEGGLRTSLLAAALAANGFPTLALAYFSAPRLPQTLTNIPLEYFKRALEWLGKQPQVDANRMVALGVSRGSEAALLLGVHYPDLVRGVIALVPSNVINCGIAGAGLGGGCLGPAWTLNGKPLPYTKEFNNPKPTDVPSAVIPVEHIHGRILLACGGVDQVWNSCDYAHAIMRRLTSHGTSSAHLYAYPRAGHGVGSALPYEPGSRQFDLYFAGTERARQDLWPHLRRFLASLG